MQYCFVGDKPLSKTIYSDLTEVCLQLPQKKNCHVISWNTSHLKKKRAINGSAMKNFLKLNIFCVFFESGTVFEKHLGAVRAVCRVTGVL